jgi:hypothetical protein
MKVYLLKTKGKGVVPDYIQVRDEKQSIIGYFKASNIEKGLDEIRLNDPERRKAAAAIFESLEFGKMIQAEL